MNPIINASRSIGIGFLLAAQTVPAAPTHERIHEISGKTAHDANDPAEPVRSRISKGAEAPGQLLFGTTKSTTLIADTGDGSVNPPVDREVAFDSFTYTGSELNSAKLPPDHFRNPILTGFFPDPSICRAGDDYFLVNSTFAYFPGLPIFHSKDLVNWTLIGHGIHRRDQLDYKGIAVTRGLFAPAIEHHDGVFYLVCTMVDGIGNFVLTATDPAGPWSDPVALDFPGIDPSLFFDDDGRVWLVHNGDPPDNKPLYDGHRAVWLREFDPVAKRMIGDARIIVNGGVDLSKKPVWIEGPHIYKRDGWYYLNCAEGGTSIDHSQVIFRSRSLTEPFVPWAGNPILTQRDLDPTAPGAVTCTGHADLIEGPDGKWWSVFLGCRPLPDGGQLTTGRETFLLPVTWTDDGWPVILPAGKRVPLVTPGPSPAASPAMPLNGDFTWTDDFDGPDADPLWLMLRAPGDKSNWGIDSGKLRLAASPAELAGSEHPAFLSRRVQHARFTATTTLDVPTGTGVTAGLALFQSEKNHYFLAIRKTDDGTSEIVVELANGGPPAIIHSAGAPAGQQLSLRINADINNLDLEWSADGTEWTKFTTPDGIKPVTVEAAGGGLHFTGAVVGPHTRGMP